MQIPADQTFHQFLHAPGRSDPGAIDGFLVVDDVGRRVEFDAAAFAEEHDASPLPGGADGGGPGGVVGGAIDSALHAIAAGELADLGDVVGTAAQDFVAEL